MGKMKPIQVAVIDPDEEATLSLVETLDTAPDIEVVGTFTSGEEAIREMSLAMPQVVLLDLRLPGMSGVECVRKLKRCHPAMRLMIFTNSEDEDALFDGLAAGASGCLLKQAKPTAIIEAIRGLHNGGSPISPGIARRLVRYLHTNAPSNGGPEKHADLSAREQEVLRILADGSPDKEIARQLKISVTTVRTYLARIFDKLGVASRTEAAVKFLKRTAS